MLIAASIMVRLEVVWWLQEQGGARVNGVTAMHKMPHACFLSGLNDAGRLIEEVVRWDDTSRTAPACGLRVI
jgi:hypothetical protein